MSARLLVSDTVAQGCGMPICVKSFDIILKQAFGVEATLFVRSWLQMQICYINVSAPSLANRC